MNEFFESLTFIAYLITGSFYCFGIYKIFDDSLISVKVWLELKIGKKWCKPLVSCPPCLASVHGSYLGLMFLGLSWEIILYCICLCGLNYTINSLLPE